LLGNIINIRCSVFVRRSNIEPKSWFCKRIANIGLAISYANLSCWAPGSRTHPPRVAWVLSEQGPRWQWRDDGRGDLPKLYLHDHRLGCRLWVLDRHSS